MAINLKLFQDEYIPKHTRKTARFQFRFWLDCSKDDELLLAEDVDILKSKRQWQPTIRDALRLILELREGKVDTLLRLFPWIEEHFKPKQDSPAVSEFALILKQQADILAHLASGTQPLTPRNTPNHFDASDKMVLDALPSMFTSEPVEVGNARENFITGMKGLFDEDEEDLWDD